MSASRGAESARDPYLASLDREAPLPVRSSEADLGRPVRDGVARELLLELMHLNPALVFLKDEQGRYVYLNKTYEDNFIHSGDWYGKTDFDFWSRESAELFRANDAAVLRSNEAHQFVEDSFDAKGDRHVWVNYKFPLTDSQGRRYCAGIGIDATVFVEQRRAAEEALRASEARANDLIRFAPTGIYEISFSPPRLLSVNDAMCSMSGYSREELLAMSPVAKTARGWTSSSPWSSPATTRGPSPARSSSAMT
jgi:PAS domain-containing protein